MRILIVDDHVDTTNMLTRWLVALGHDARAANTAADALATLPGGGPFDVVVCDLSLPDLDGADLLPQLRAAGCTAPAVAVSGHAGGTARSLAAGFAAHLAKPVDLDSLGSLLGQVSAAGRPPGG
ncbi:MAG TPA: response regulator [Humisphaera sp.]